VSRIGCPACVILTQIRFPPPVAVGVVGDEYLRRVQGLVYVAHKDGRATERNRLSPRFVLAPQRALIRSHSS
jgi:hypothetical protein